MARSPVIALCLLLAACAAEPPLPLQERQAQWDRQRALLAALEEWRLRGRIAVQVEDGGWTASLQWRQQGDEYVLRLSAPLGRGTVELSGSPAGVQMVTADNRLLHARDPQTLMQENLGWQVPLRGLRYWVRGMPEPGTRPERLSLDKQGRVEGFSQDGWQVRYERYETTGAYQLPGKMTLENAQLRVRLVIHEWTLPV